MKLEEAVSRIRPADETAVKMAEQKWMGLAKPLGSLGLLEDAVIRMAGVFGTEEVRLENRELFVFCADNGVVRNGVSQSDSSVTAAVARALGNGTSTANYMAEPVRCRVLPVDIGMEAHPPFPGLLECPVRRGTDDFTMGPAMSRAECIRAIEAGISLAERSCREGVSIILAGEMGIGNTTTSCAVASVLLQMEPARLAGRGAGLSDEGLERKIRAIEKGIRVNRPDAEDPVDLLSKVGGLDLAALCGLCIGGACFRIPVLLDGFITVTAAALALRLCPACRFALIPGHVSAEPAAGLLLRQLGMEAPVHAGMRLGEGTGALAALALLDLSLAVYNSGHTFGHLGIEAYQPFDHDRLRFTV